MGKRSVVETALAAGLDLGRTAFVLQAAFDRTLRRPCPDAGPLDFECGGEPFCEASPRLHAVAQLRTLVAGDDANRGAELFEETGPLSWPERRRTGDVEDQFDPRVGRVHMLATWSAGSRETPDQLVFVDLARRRDPQHASKGNYLLLLNVG
jgi:hypothetical protein